MLDLDKKEPSSCLFVITRPEVGSLKEVFLGPVTLVIVLFD